MEITDKNGLKIMGKWKKSPKIQNTPKKSKIKLKKKREIERKKL